MRARVLLALLLALVAGCAAPPPGPTGPASPAQPRVVTVTEGPYCPSEQPSPAQEVVRDSASWQRFWSTYCTGAFTSTGAPPGPPPVDFAAHSVLGVFWGARSTGGYSVRIGNATVAGGNATVDVARVAPGPGCVRAQIVSYPHDVATSDEPLPAAVAFAFNDTVQPC